jgi:hypothetical protein
MAKIRVKGTVYYPPGPWGANLPVGGATIRIIDVDAPGKGDDTIWTGTTDGNGNFDGMSSEWQDSTTTSIWMVDSIVPPRGHWQTITIPDLTDARLLNVKITKGSSEITLPFPYVSDEAPPIPLVVNWFPQPFAIANVNGIDITTDRPGDIHDKIKALVEARTPSFKVRVYGPYATALEPITRPRAELQQWVVQRLGLPASTHILTPNLADWAIVTICIVIAVVIIALGLGVPVSTGAGIFLACLGIAVVIAVATGYARINATQCTRLDIPATNIPVGWSNCVEITFGR